MEAAVQHKETTHYKTWRDTVAGMMAESRSSVKYSEVFPPPEVVKDELGFFNAKPRRQHGKMHPRRSSSADAFYL